MLSTGTPPDWASVDIAVPRPSGRLPGVSMAGFRHRAPALADIAMVAHPSVTLLVDLSEGEGLVHDTHGRHERGSIDQSHLHREVKALAGLTPTALANAPWLAIDDVAWPASSPTRSPVTRGGRIPDLR